MTQCDFYFEVFLEAASLQRVYTGMPQSQLSIYAANLKMLSLSADWRGCMEKYSVLGIGVGPMGCILSYFGGGLY